jgi:hypothetical protein
MRNGRVHTRRAAAAGMTAAAGSWAVFARGDGIDEIARGLRVMPGPVRRWRRVWQDSGAEALIHTSGVGFGNKCWESAGR